MAAHRDPRLLHNLSHHPRWQQELTRREGNRRERTEVADTVDSSLFGALATSFPVLRSKSCWGNWLILPLLLAICLPCEAWGSTYKVVIIGPWTCDPVFSSVLPELAARLAVSRINKDPYISKGYWYDYVIVNEECKSSCALARFAKLQSSGSAFLGPANPGYCSSAALFTKNWNKGLLSWACLKPNMHEGHQYPTFLRPLPLSSRVLFSVLRFFRWAHVAIVSAEGDLWEATGNELASSLRTLGLQVSTVVTMEADEEGPRRALSKIREADHVRVVIMCMHSVLIGGDAQYQLLTTAKDMRMIARGYVFIPYDTLLYALPYRDASYPVLANDTKLRQAYDGVLTITMDQGERNFFEAFRDAQDRNEIHASIQPQQVSPFFGTIYNMLYYLAMSVEQARRSEGSRWVSGQILAKSEGGFDFEGFNQPLTSGSDGEGMQGRYVVLDTNGRGTGLYSTHVLEAASTFGKFGALRYQGRAIHFGGSSPSTDSGCWFNPHYACSGGTDGRTLVFLFLLFILLAGGGAALFMRLKQSGKFGIISFGGGGGEEEGGGSVKMVLSLDDLIFINTQISKRKMNEDSMLKSQLDVKTPCHSVSGRSYFPSTVENSNVAIFEGDWVWLKRWTQGNIQSDIKENTHIVFTKLRDMRHENVNLYMGLFIDSGIFGIVTEHCTRGSLEDLLSNEDMRLDWMFKSSLMMDLIRGMKYLHNRNVVHGRLKSRNLVVDGRFVLKVTDYGFNEIMDTQNIPEDQTRPEDQLWTAPELLRDSNLMKKGTFSGDVYSYSIIMQEIISRNSPFCMLDMPAKEIIAKIKSPPPLCRPSVTVDEAPLEIIQIMKQCWSEEPEKRLTFEDIFRQVKNVTKGKKTNIIDSMLRMLEQYSSNLEDLIRERTDELEVERHKTDNLLAQMLPRSVAKALTAGKPVKPEHFSVVTLYFSDIVGFTTISALSEPIEVVDLLNDLYSLFDAIIGQHDVYKVETIGDAYMVASGVPNRNDNRHAAEISNMSLDILHCIGAFKMRHMPDVKVRIRIGMHSGPVVAGVVGLTMPRYCLFGDTVNTASRMETTGLPYRIHINQSTVDILKVLKLGYQLDGRGLTELKGKGIEHTYWLVGREGYNKPLPKPLDLTPGAATFSLSLDEIPEDRRQKYIERQKKMTN